MRQSGQSILRSDVGGRMGQPRAGVKSRLWTADLKVRAAGRCCDGPGDCLQFLAESGKSKQGQNVEDAGTLSMRRW